MVYIKRFFQVTSMRLAYEELSIKQKKEEEKIKAIDPKKASQMERLGMGLGARGYAFFVYFYKFFLMNFTQLGVTQRFMMLKISGNCLRVPMINFSFIERRNPKIYNHVFKRSPWLDLDSCVTCTT